MAATLDFEPPAACVTRIVKSILPSNVMLTKEAKAALTRAAGIFIFYLTHCANEFTKEGKRSTIFAQDIKNALRELDFEDFEAPLDEFLEMYRKAQKEAGAERKAAKAASKAAGASGADMQVDEEEVGDADDEDVEEEDEDDVEEEEEVEEVEEVEDEEEA